MANAGADIEKVRRSLGLTQTQFATLLGVHAITVSRWENGALTPTPYQAGLIRQFQQAARHAARSHRPIADDIAAALVGAGAIAGLYLILKWAFNEKQALQDEEQGKDESAIEEDTSHRSAPVVRAGKRKD